MSRTQTGTRPEEVSGLSNSKTNEAPDDLRFNGSLPRYLWVAPHDEDPGFVWEVWSKGCDPRDVWPERFCDNCGRLVADAAGENAECPFCGYGGER